MTARVYVRAVNFFSFRYKTIVLYLAKYSTFVEVKRESSRPPQLVTIDDLTIEK
jgi:hypothetical protein